MAHQQGLKSIRTELVQIPSEANHRVAIAVATVVLEKEGKERVFTGIGDASINNVAPAMQTCLIRMAETRSKARALRDAVNIGVAAFEELGEEDAHDGAPERGYPLTPGRSTRTPAPRSQSNGVTRPPTTPSIAAASLPAEMRNPAADPLTEDQTKALRNLCRRLQLDPDALAKERFDVEGLGRITQSQAGDLIKSLSAQANGRTPAAV